MKNLFDKKFTTLYLFGALILSVIVVQSPLFKESFAAKPTLTPTPKITAEGYLRVLVEDDFKNKTSKEKYYLQDDNNVMSPIEYNGKLNIKPGSRINVTTTNTLGTGLLLVTSSSDISVVDQSTINSNSLISGTKRVALILANFNDLSATMPTNNYMENLVNTNINNYFREVSFNKVSYANTNVFGTYTLPITSNCDTWKTQNPNGDYFWEVTKAAIAAADPTLDYNLYQQIMLIVPPTCSLGAFGWYPPGPTFSTGEGSKALLTTLYNSDYWTNTNYGVQIIAHEFGHNFGAKHSNGWECGTSVYNENCSSTEYGEPTNVMGGEVDWGYVASFSPYEKELFGWISGANTRIINTSGTYTVDPIEKPSTGIQMLKIPRIGTSTYYTIDNRIKYGVDVNYPTSAVAGGLIKIVPIYPTVDVTQLIDSHPNINVDSYTSRKDFNDAGYLLNQTFTDPERGLSITPLSKSNNVLSVNVTFYSPTLISPTNGAFNASKTFTWTAIPKATNYTLRVSTNSTFSTTLVNTIVTGTSYTVPTTLPTDTTLYWDVRANYSFGSSDWSPTWNTKISSLTPIFSDVPIGSFAQKQIEALYNAGITGGCSNNPLSYCPNTNVNRAQMAVFLLKAKYGKTYTPPSVGTSTGFSDVPTTHWAAPWIKQLAVMGVTSGCGNGNYCPDVAVTRDQMAVFLLRTKYGSSYNPPPVGSSTGFNDVPKTHWAAPWIKQLAALGITSGCGNGNYCPTNPVTRAQMAVFLVTTFNIPI